MGRRSSSHALTTRVVTSRSRRWWLRACLPLAIGFAGLAPSPAGTFSEVAGAAGLRFVHRSPAFDAPLAHINQLWAGFIAGAAVGDVDGDGLDDVLFVSARPDHASVLYRNRGHFQFEDVTAAWALPPLSPAGTCATGARWFDYDNDGRLDLFVYGFGVSRLFRNEGARFRDVTAASGLDGHHQNAIAAIAFDADNDGRLDLLVGGFFADAVDLFRLRTTRVLPRHGLTADNGGSKRLFRNEGNGRFADVSNRAGIADTGFTVAIGHADVDNDGWQDVYVANDFGQDRLYRNNRDGTFADVTLDALGPDGRKGMNVDFGDIDNDGRLEIYVTNITEPWLRECNMLWLNWKDGPFVDISQETRTCDTGWGWGAKFLDYDHDGRLDLFVASGFISGDEGDYQEDVDAWQTALRKASRMADVVDAATWPPLGTRSFNGHEPNRLFHNDGEYRFSERARSAGVDSRADSRGVAIADFDNDGAQDVLVTNVNTPALLYRNGMAAGHWLELRLTGTRSNRNGIGARVTVTTGDTRQIRDVDGGNGYAAQSSLRLHVGLGQHTSVDSVEIAWPSGTRQRIGRTRADQILRVIEDDTTAPPPARR